MTTLPCQFHASPCLKSQSGAPASFAGEEQGCHHPRAYYSSQPETSQNSCGHVHLRQAASGCKGHPGGAGGRHGSAHSPNACFCRPVSALACISMQLSNLYLLWFSFSAMPCKRTMSNNFLPCDSLRIGCCELHGRASRKAKSRRKAKTLP